VFIDAVVMCDNVEEDHRMTHSFFMNPAYCGDVREPDVAPPPMPLNMRKVIGRRATMEIRRNDIINLGTGIPNDTVGSVLAEEGVANEVTLTVESGIYGGLPLGGVDFGIAKNCYALVRHDDQFDFYNGAGVDVTFMGAGEVDKDGNVNATRLGPNPTGAGGFVDITTNAKHVVFCSTFTGKGLDCSFKGGKLTIKQEGSLKKCVNKLQQVSYNAKIALEKGHKMHYVTERAVFELREEGLVLTEIAQGIDLQKDVLDQMEFVPVIAKDLKIIPTDIYNDGPFGLDKWL
jgi:propionate CoA-transferase